MNDMEQHRCRTCGGDLYPSDIKYGRKGCVSCRDQKRIATLLNDASLKSSFSTLWAKDLFKGLGKFLQERGVSLQAQARMLSKVVVMFQEAEKIFCGREEMSEEWLEKMIEKGRPPHNILYAVGESNLANPLAILTTIAYTPS
jgi:hypothetical protein